MSTKKQHATSLVGMENPEHFALRCTLREAERGLTYPDNFPVTYANLVHETLERVYSTHTGKFLDWAEIERYDDPVQPERPF